MYQMTHMNYYGAPSTTDAFPSSQRYAIIDLEAERRKQKAEKQHRAMLENQKMQKFETRLRKQMEQMTAQFAQMIDSKQNLDNPNNANITGISKGTENDMSIERRRVLIGQHDNGEPIYKHLQADSINEMNDRIVKAYVESGRIWEFIENENKTMKKTQTLFKTYTENWMETFKKPKLKPKPYQTYIGYLRSHLYPAFGDRYIEDITPQDIQKFLNERENAAKKSLNNYIGLLSQILDAAVEDKLITENPARSKRIANPSNKANPREALPETQVRDIMKNLFQLENCAEKLMVALFMFTGMRRGEVLGLRWDDIDFDEKCIHIQRNVTHPGNPAVIGTTKTKSGERSIYFGSNLETLLLAMKGEGFIFGGDQPLSRKAYNTLIGRVNKKINLYGATPHTLRHTMLTTAAGENIDNKTLQSIAGHSTEQMTTNTYVHPKTENLAKAGQMIDTLLGEYAKVG